MWLMIFWESLSLFSFYQDVLSVHTATVGRPSFLSAWYQKSLRGPLIPRDVAPTQTQRKLRSLTWTRNTWTVWCSTPEDKCICKVTHVNWRVVDSLHPQLSCTPAVDRHISAEKPVRTRRRPVKTCSPLAASSSIGCLKSVMSRKVQRKSTTLSFSLRIGAICM